ncbi:YdeI/OmpD-associated family protein [Clostridium sp. LIBA-8841]|uniref:YdeI/OmpD-associated family protein n=1 Tax=Clostridium sp. LIBA-8841 TaxID=2987530 RepID=UPI002AC658BB|nr:YdeI/OmpD-associated family protein [Clostridium sp. LIBA-8841]MDZ5253999.1 YdeI/OmpD-associated family protein [Clostridium sp. LIBA-8841]
MVYKFEAVIKKHDGKDATFIEIPFDVEETFGSKRVKVKAKFDGFEYRGSIVKMGLPCYMIGITKAIRKEIGKEAGDSIIVEVEKDEEERVVELPEDFKLALDKNKVAKDFYESLSYSVKRKYVQWVTSAKKIETREKRINEAVIKLENNIKI